MPYTRASAKFYGLNIGFETWSGGPSAYAYRNITADDKENILLDLDRLNFTALGRNLLNRAIDANSLRFVGFDDVLGLQGGPAYALNASIGNSIESVQINYAAARDTLYWFNSSGILVKADAALVIAHELAHIVYETFDPAYGINDNVPFNATLNAPNFDFDGPQVRAQNIIARQMGSSNQVRVSYFGAVYGALDLANFQTGVSYTDGATVDVVRRGSASVDNIDHSLKTSSSPNGLRDLIFGEGGDDIIDAGAGADFILGGAGGDIIHGGTGNDTIWGDDKFGLSSTGEDILYGDAGNDTIHGGGDTDYIYGGTGTDTLNGDEGDDRLFGDSGADRLRGGDGEDTLRGGDGNDTLSGGNDIDALYGEAGDDILFGDGGDDILFGGDGADDIFGGTGDDLIKGGTGKDLIYGFDGIDEIEGGTGDDTIFGDDGDDIIRGEDGADTVFGGIGNDLISGGAGIDTLYGEDGDDSLVGGGGADKLVSGRGDNNGLFGEAGNDTLEFDLGGGVASGGTGSDTIIVKSGSFVSAEGGQGNDVIDVREATGRVEMLWYAGDGFDHVISNRLNVDGLNSVESLLSYLEGVGGVPRFRGLTDVTLDIPIANAQIIWQVELVAQGSVGEDYPIPYYIYRGHFAVIDKTQTGIAGIDIGEIYGVSPYSDPVSFSQTYLTFINMPVIRFTDGEFYKSGEGQSNVEIIFGSLPTAPVTGQASAARVLQPDISASAGAPSVVGNAYDLADEGVSLADAGSSPAQLLSVSFEFPNDTMFGKHGSIIPNTSVASAPKLDGLDARLNLMIQNMASFGVSQGEGNFGSKRGQAEKYDYFA